VGFFSGRKRLEGALGHASSCDIPITLLSNIHMVLVPASKHKLLSRFRLFILYLFLRLTVVRPGAVAALGPSLALYKTADNFTSRFHCGGAGSDHHGRAVGRRAAS
jgi:hypothetical protein